MRNFTFEDPFPFVQYRFLRRIPFVSRSVTRSYPKVHNNLASELINMGDSENLAVKLDFMEQMASPNVGMTCGEPFHCCLGAGLLARILLLLSLLARL